MAEANIPPDCAEALLSRVTAREAVSLRKTKKTKNTGLQAHSRGRNTTERKSFETSITLFTVAGHRHDCSVSFAPPGGRVEGGERNISVYIPERLM